MNEYQAQALAQRIRAHLPHVEVMVKKSSDLQDWIQETYAAQDAEIGYIRPPHDDDGTWGCQMVIAGEQPTKTTTRIARVYFEEGDWESYIDTFEPLIHRFLEHVHHTRETQRTSRRSRTHRSSRRWKGDA